MNATETFTESHLIAAIKTAEIQRLAAEELFPSEMGGELNPSTMIVALDGESFTVQALQSFSVISPVPGVGTIHVNRGERIKFNRFLEPVRR